MPEEDKALRERIDALYRDMPERNRRGEATYTAAYFVQATSAGTLNQVIAYGRVISEPEIRWYSHGGDPLAWFKLHCRHKYTDAAGAEWEEAEFLRVRVKDARQMQWMRANIHAGDMAWAVGMLRYWSVNDRYGLAVDQQAEPVLIAQRFGVGFVARSGAREGGGGKVHGNGGNHAPGVGRGDGATGD